MSLGAIVVIAVIVLVYFGGKRLPDAGGMLGKAVRVLRSKADSFRNDKS